MANGPAKVPPADVSNTPFFRNYNISKLEKTVLNTEITRSLKSPIISLKVCSLIKVIDFRNISMGLSYLKHIVAYFQTYYN